MITNQILKNGLQKLSSNLNNYKTKKDIKLYVIKYINIIEKERNIDFKASEHQKVELDNVYPWESFLQKIKNEERATKPNEFFIEK